MYSLFIGTSTEKSSSKGIYYAEIEKGQEPRLTLAAESENPYFLLKRGNILYVGCELMDKCRVEAYTINGEKLELLSRQDAPSCGCCHVTVSADGKVLCAANYAGGSVCVFPLLENGAIGEMSFMVQRTGKGPLQPRQDAPHIHSTAQSPDGRSFWALDLGTDSLVQFAREPGSTEVKESGVVVKFPGGEGPRHMTFSPDGKLGYIVAELGNAVFVVELEPDGMRVLQRINVLPEGYTDTCTASEIELSRDGRFLYVAARGWNGIAIFSVGEDGLLTRAGETTCFGNWPWHFALSPEGDMLAICNQRSNHVQVCEMDRASGAILEPSITIPVEMPLCAIWC
ncbi:MAG: lactonase family protein [Oscillospiraceae bacterium]